MIICKAYNFKQTVFFPRHCGPITNPSRYRLDLTHKLEVVHQWYIWHWWWHSIKWCEHGCSESQMG